MHCPLAVIFAPGFQLIWPSTLPTLNNFASREQQRAATFRQ